MDELNSAMSRIQAENRYYTQQLSRKYIVAAGANLFLGADEKRWLEDHQRESEYATVIAQLDAFMSDGYIDPRESRNIADAIGRLLSGMHK